MYVRIRREWKGSVMTGVAEQLGEVPTRANSLTRTDFYKQTEEGSKLFTRELRSRNNLS